ncbi:RNA-guided endonuclease TnpB family protein [Actinokineospora sp.]|uniref:RNA-guided endonuclease TnpB family protein n=1 Tax=Actinokineospora sp. TaxID=1872133 RepID=UPI003D6C387F
MISAFTVEVRRSAARPSRPNAVVGVDLGLTTLATLSNGKMAPNPRHLATALTRLRATARTLARRTGPDRSIRQRRSNRWEKARRKLSRQSARVANLRRDSLHKLTTNLANTYGTIVVEDLHVAGMIKNRRLSRAIADAGFSEFRRQLDYKMRWRGGRLVIAERWFPSSKTCSTCGAVKPKLPLRARTLGCEHCGLTMDRDLNAARNLENYYVAQSGWETQNGRGADQKTGPGPAGGDETSTPRRNTG